MHFILDPALIVNAWISSNLDDSSSSSPTSAKGTSKELTKTEILKLCKETMQAQTVNQKYNRFNSMVNEFVMTKMKNEVSTSCFYKINVKVATSGDSQFFQTWSNAPMLETSQYAHL